MRAVSLFGTTKVKSTVTPAVEPDRFAGMSNDEIRAQLARDRQAQRVDHEEKMAVLNKTAEEQKELLARYQAGTATIEELMAFHKRLGHF